jgi:hypothetical protein
MSVHSNTRSVSLKETRPNEPCHPNSGRSKDRYDGYWRVVKREVYERFLERDVGSHHAWLVGQPRSYATPIDELLPPFSDWSVDIGSTAAPRSIREVDAYRPRPGQLGR